HRDVGGRSRERGLSFDAQTRRAWGASVDVTDRRGYLLVVQRKRLFGRIGRTGEAIARGRYRDGQVAAVASHRGKRGGTVPRWVTQMAHELARPRGAGASADWPSHALRPTRHLARATQIQPPPPRAAVDDRSRVASAVCEDRWADRRDNGRHRGTRAGEA